MNGETETQVVVVESGYKTSSANYRFWASDPLPADQARALFQAVRAGSHESLPAKSGAQVVDAGDNQFLRLTRSRGATVLDRVTIGAVSTQ